MWDFIRNSSLIWIGLCCLAGLAFLMVEHTIFGLVAAAFLAVVGYVFYRLCRVPTQAEMEKLQRQNAGRVQKSCYGPTADGHG